MSAATARPRARGARRDRRAGGLPQGDRRLRRGRARAPRSSSRAPRRSASRCSSPSSTRAVSATRSPRSPSTSATTPRLPKTVVLGRARRGLRPRRARPGARLRHRGPRLRQPRPCSTCSPPASRSTSPRDATGLAHRRRPRHRPAPPGAGRRDAHERRDRAASSCSARPARPSSRAVQELIR